jgi:hypothetical protein
MTSAPDIALHRAKCRKGPIGDIVATVRLTSEPIQDGDFGAIPDLVVNIL